MLRYLKAELKRMGISCRQDRQGNLYAVKGRAKTYPCVVAHVDEVHRHRTGTYGAHVVADAMVIGYDHRHKCMTGIGADDKNGIWICLKCLEDFKVMKCVFFVQEENGCIGSRGADMAFFSDCRFVLQCDRWGEFGLYHPHTWHGTLYTRLCRMCRPHEIRLQAGRGCHNGCVCVEKKGTSGFLRQYLLRVLRAAYGS